jgi:hypothetical protein
VALLWGERSLSVRCAYRKAIDKEFGPSDIGPGGRGGRIDSS